VQGTISNGAFSMSLSREEVTLRDLFPSLSDVFAIRLDQNVRGIDVEAGDFLLIKGDAADAQMAVAMIGGEAAVCHVSSTEGQTSIQFPDGSSLTVGEQDQVKVLGRYAGHINRSGLYRFPSNGYAVTEG
jgi:hypothetical protein